MAVEVGHQEGSPEAVASPADLGLGIKARLSFRLLILKRASQAFWMLPSHPVYAQKGGRLDPYLCQA